MKTDTVIELIMDELKKAEKKHPFWPTDQVHAAAILAEEAGEVVKAAINFHYGKEKNDEELIKETAQTGAMAIRLLLHLPEPAKTQSGGEQ